MLGDPPDASLVAARRGLLDAVEVLSSHLGRAILVGAQAIYLHTADTVTGVALFTKDADVVLLPPLNNGPDIEEAMRAAGFTTDRDPGIWRNETTQVDLLVPEAFASGTGRRTAELEGHGRATARRVAGLEAVSVDFGPMTIRSLDAGDPRQIVMSVAGPGALLIAKLYKLGERAAEKDQRRLEPKDAFDVFRLLQLPTADVALRVRHALDDPTAGPVAAIALEQAADLFSTPASTGSRLAGAYVAGVGDPATVAAGASVLANDLLRLLSAASPQV